MMPVVEQYRDIPMSAPKNWPALTSSFHAGPPLKIMAGSLKDQECEEDTHFSKWILPPQPQGLYKMFQA